MTVLNPLVSRDAWGDPPIRSLALFASITIQEAQPRREDDLVKVRFDFEG
jgi:hypothetical protein